MKKIIKLLIALVMGVTVFPLMSESILAKSVNEDTYPMQQGCNGFEVDTVKDDGNFDYRGCYSDFSEAKNAMNQLGDDAVVRKADSNKQTKIIAMVAGVAYTCEWEKGGTVSLNQKADYAGVTGYMPSYRQINYVSTDTYTGNGHGQVTANIGGFECYVDLDVIELIPYKYVDRQIAIHLADDLYVKPNIASYTVVQNGNYRDLVYTAYGIFKTDGSSANTVMNTAVGPAPSWMATGRTYYSVDDVHFYNDRKMNSLAGTYYNYYQFEPLRTKTALTANDLNEFLHSLGYTAGTSAIFNKGQSFIDAQNKYGMNAALVFAQACLESAYGSSEYAKNRNNLFGWNAVDSDPNQATYFKSVDDCINQQMALNLRGFLYADDWRFFGAHFGNKSSGITFKYASDPYYGLKISSIMYALDKYASGNNGSLSEYSSDTLGVIHTYMAPVYSSVGGNILYTTEYKRGYQDNNTVAILSEEGDYYKIQSDNLLENNRCVNVLTDSSVREFNWNTDIGYIKKSDVDVLYTATTTKPNPSTDPDEDVDPSKIEIMSSVSDISYQNSNTVLHIEGRAFLRGISAKKTEDVSHTVLIENLEDGTIVKEIPATTVMSDNALNLYDGYTYSAIGYKADINMSEFADGNYALKIQVTNHGYTQSRYIISNRISELQQVTNDDGTLTRVYPSSMYSNRFEVSRSKDTLDYSSINKPTQRFSARSIKNVAINNGTLTFNGYAFIYKASMTEGDHPDYTVILQNENGEKYSFDVNNTASPSDYATLLGYDTSLNYADYSASIDLSQLPVGTYRMYIEIKNDSYNDIEELYSYRPSAVDDYSFNGHTYSIHTSNVHSRYILEVK